MVRYRGRVVRVEPVYGEGNVIIEAWVTFKVKGYEIETYHVGIPIAPEIGKEYIVDFKLSAHDILCINIEEKMFKQISTFPRDPRYFVMGEVTKIKDRRYEKHGENEAWILNIEIDCGIKMDAEVGGWGVERLKEGDYVAFIGKMFGEIVKE